MILLEKKNNNGVVSKVNEQELWKEIPGYTFRRYSVSNLGNIRREIRNGEFRILKQTETNTSVGTYLTIAITDDFNKHTHKGLHQLVCLAFHGDPPIDGQKYEVNHKDGDKHNNKASNLEWMTRIENTLHAIRSGLRDDNIPVEVKDVLSGETTTYYSIIELSRQWLMTRNDIKRLISRHSKVPYLGKWLFKLDIEKLGMINRPYFDNIKAYDYVENKLIITNNAAEMEYYTGIQASTILLRTGKRDRKTKDTNVMLGGYIFKIFKDNSDFPIFSKDEAINSREDYFNKTHTAKNLPYLVKNYVTGEIKEYSNLKQMTVSEGMIYSSCIDWICDNVELNIRKGKAFKKKSDVREWKDYSNEIIQQSLIKRIFI